MEIEIEYRFFFFAFLNFTSNLVRNRRGADLELVSPVKSNQR